jgi:hypothetical protein
MVCAGVGTFRAVSCHGLSLRAMIGSRRKRDPCGSFRTVSTVHIRCHNINLRDAHIGCRADDFDALTAFCRGNNNNLTAA